MHDTVQSLRLCGSTFLSGVLNAGEIDMSGLHLQPGTCLVKHWGDALRTLGIWQALVTNAPKVQLNDVMSLTGLDLIEQWAHKQKAAGKSRDVTVQRLTRDALLLSWVDSREVSKHFWVLLTNKADTTYMHRAFGLPGSNGRRKPFPFGKDVAALFKRGTITVPEVKEKAEAA